MPPRFLAANLTLPSEGKNHLKERRRERNCTNPPPPQQQQSLNLIPNASNSLLAGSQAPGHSPKQTLVQWQLLLTSQGDQMAHLSTTEKEEQVRDGEKEKKNMKDTETERLCISLGISSLPRVYCLSSPNHCSPEDNPMKAYSEQSRAKEMVLSMASRKHVTEEPRRNLLPLRTPHCRHFRHTPAPADQVKNTVGPLVLLGHAG